jgi:hypothetical protein
MGYCSNTGSMSFATSGVNSPYAVTAGTAVEQLCEGFQKLLGSGVTLQLQLNACHFLVAGLLLVSAVVLLGRRLSKRRVFVLDFAVHKPHER